MKNIQKYLIILFLTIFAWSCTEKDLEITPTQENEKSYYKLDAQVEAANWACYSQLKLNDFWGWTQMLWGNFASDDAVTGGESPNDRIGYHQADNYTLSPNDPSNDIYNMWKNTWKGVYRCNLVIHNISEPYNALQAQAVAEAKVLKATYYFYLSRMFGRLPVFNDLPDPTAPVTRASLDETWTSMETWLKEAINIKKPDGSSALTTAIGTERVSMGYAKALLGKIMLYEASPNWLNKSEKYAEALTYLKDVETYGYHLLSNYADIFQIDFNPEDIFEVNYARANGPGGTSSGNYEIQLCGIRSGDVQINDTITSGWGFDQPTIELVDLFKANNDKIRLNATAIPSDSLQEWHYVFVRKNRAPGFDYKTDDSTINWVNSLTGYWDAKRRPNPQRKNSSWQTSDNNNILLRLADVYLMIAEAAQRSGNDAEAQTYLNKVRERVKLTAVTSTGADLYAAIKLERRLELALEGERYFDLVRWGDAEAELGDLNYSATSTPGTNTKGLFPIPQGEINRNQGSNNIEQNPGY